MSRPALNRPILPGSVIGILGGGQLGRMMAMSAQTMGYRVQVMDPDPTCPARAFADKYVQGFWEDADSATVLARECDIVTLEIEKISLECLTAAQQFAPVRPGPGIMHMIQNRIRQKAWLRHHGFPVGPHLAVETVEDTHKAAEVLGNDMFLKSAQGGYDGRSQICLTQASPTDVEDAWRALNRQPCVAEQAVAVRMEISVSVARSPRGEVRTFFSARNHHENQVLVWSVMPSSISPAMEDAAQDLAGRIAAALELEGILAVEMFVTEAGELLVNELAPRPHNSYHESEQACAVSQFEQAVRAVCDLPLGDTEILRPAAIANLFGDLWLDREPQFDRALTVPGVRLHLYGKSIPQKGRKMGHLSASGATAEQALERVLAAKDML